MPGMTINEKIKSGDRNVYRGLGVTVKDEWRPAPAIPESFNLAMRQFSERFGLQLSLSWDGWGHYWQLNNRERTFDFGAERWITRDVVFFEILNEQFEFRPLEDMRIWDEIAANYIGDKPGDFIRNAEKQAEDRAKRDAAQHQALFEKSMENADTVLAKYHDAKSDATALSMLPRRGRRRRGNA